MLKKSTALLIGVLVLPVTVLASSSSVSCPGVTDIKNANYSILPDTDPHTEQPIANHYIAGAEFQAIDSTGLSYHWQVMIGTINASDVSEAQDKLNKVLNYLKVVNQAALSSDEMPDMFKSDDIAYTCYLDTPYQTDSNFFFQPEKTSNPFIQAIDKMVEPYRHNIVLTASPNN